MHIKNVNCVYKVKANAFTKKRKIFKCFSVSSIKSNALVGSFNNSLKSLIKSLCLWDLFN